MGKDKLKRFAENLTFPCFVQPEFVAIIRSKGVGTANSFTTTIR